MSEPAMSDLGQWLAGVGLAIAGHAISAIVAMAVVALGGLSGEGESGPLWMIAAFLVLGAGVAQAMWIAPIAIVAYKRDRKRIAWGALVTGGVVFLLNGACWGILAGSGGLF